MSPRTPGSAGRSGPVSFTGRPDRVVGAGADDEAVRLVVAGRDGAARLGRPVSVFAGAALNRDRRRVGTSASPPASVSTSVSGFSRGGAAGFGAAARARRAASASRCALFCAARFCFDGFRSATK